MNNLTSYIIVAIVCFLGGMFADFGEQPVKYIPKIVTERDTTYIASPPELITVKDIKTRTIVKRDTFFYNDGMAHITIADSSVVSDTTFLSEKTYEMDYVAAHIRAEALAPVTNFVFTHEMKWDKINEDIFEPNLKFHGKQQYRKGLLIGAISGAAIIFAASKI